VVRRLSPRSTVYGRRDDLQTAGLLGSFTRIRPDGHHTANGECSLDDPRRWLDENREPRARVDRAGRGPDERPATLWSPVRKET
jgi:hypothetical protein